MRYGGPLLDPSLKGGPFKFNGTKEIQLDKSLNKERDLPMDWKKIKELDLKKLMQSGNTEALRGLITTVTFGRVTGEDIKMVGTGATAKLIRVLQLAIEHLLTQSKEKPFLTKGKNYSLIEEQRPSPRFKQQEVYYECKLCNGKRFISENYLQAHYKRRHPEYKENGSSSQKEESKPQIGEIRDMLNNITSKIMSGTTKVKTQPIQLEKLLLHHPTVEKGEETGVSITDGYINKGKSN